MWHTKKSYEMVLGGNIFIWIDFNNVSLTTENFMKTMEQYNDIYIY